MQGAVELAVAAAVEAVADRLAGRGGDRGGAGEARERGLASMRPWCDQEIRTWAAASGPTPGSSRSCGASLRVSVSISRCELAFLSGQLLGRGARARAARAASRGARVAAAFGTDRGEPAQQLRACERRSSLRSGSGRRDEQAAQLAERRPLARSRRLRARPSARAALRARRRHAAGRAASGRARSRRLGSRRARRSCRPSVARAGAADLEHPLAHARRGSESGPRRTSRCPRSRTHAGPARAARRAASAAA